MLTDAHLMDTMKMYGKTIICVKLKWTISFIALYIRLFAFIFEILGILLLPRL